MLKGARIDLETSNDALNRLLEAYPSDIKAGEVSDGAIAAVSTSLRCVEGALGKIADRVYKEFGTGRATPYFPIADEESKFDLYMKKKLPGVADKKPAVAEAIERQQPYHRDQRQLALLKPLYRENHHHDYTFQKSQPSVSWDMRAGGKVVQSIHSLALDPSPVAPLWRGVPITIRPGSQADGKGMTDWQDWHFADLGVSVFGTLQIIHNLAVKACREVWASTGL